MKRLWILVVCLIICTLAVFGFFFGISTTAASAAASSTVQLSKSAPVEPSPHPILSDVRVRRAIAYCTDKEGLIESVYPDLTPEERQDLVMDTFVPKTSWAYTTTFVTYPYSPTLGEALLESAGWTFPVGKDYRMKDGKELVLGLISTNTEFRQTYLAVFESQMAACGIHLILNYPPGDWLFGSRTGLQMRDFEVTDFAWILQEDPDGRSLYACDQIPLPTNGWQGQNFMGWCNQTASDAIVQASDTALHQDQRKAHYATFIELFAEDVPSIPLFLRSPVSEGIWEHIDFNLQTFLQQTEISPTFEATLNFTDYHGNAGSIEIPAGAVSSPMSLGFQPLVSASHPAPDGLASPLSFRLEAFVNGAPQESFTFLEPITITLPYSPGDLGEIYGEESLDLYLLEDPHWQIAADSCPLEERYQSLDTTAHQLTVRFCHLTEFSLMGTRAYPVYLPLVDH